MQSNKPTVWIKKKQPAESDRDIVYRTLIDFNAARLFDGSEKVLINPNWIIAEHSSRGNVTSTDTLAGIVKYLIREAKIPPENIVVGDGGYPSDTDEAMRINGVFQLKEEFGIDVRNLNNEKMIEKHPTNPLALKSVNIAKIADEVDVIISVPSLKTHSMAITTLSMKLH